MRLNAIFESSGENETKPPRGTGDALRVCQSALRSERFLVVNGDDLYGARDLAAL